MSKSLKLPAWMENYGKPKPKDCISQSLLKKPRLISTLPHSPKREEQESESADVAVCNQFWQIAEFCEKLLLKADKDDIVIGLDSDWPNIYKSLSGKTSEIHICFDKNKCCSLEVSGIKFLPKSFTLLLKHPRVILVGYNLANDVDKLGKDFSFDVTSVLEKIKCSEPLNKDSIYCSHNWSVIEATNKKFEVSTAETSSEKPKRRLFRFIGRLKYSNHFATCAAAAEEILEFAENFSDDKKLILGFDLEWPFSYASGSGKVALVQICPNKDECYILHIPKLKSLPVTLVRLLSHKNVLLVGVNIANDIRKIGRDFKIETQNILENNIVDVGSYANQVLNISERWSLDRLVLHLLGMELEKPAHVRCSNWAQEDLSGQQLVYAAADAYAGLAVYNHLKRINETRVKKKPIENQIN